MTTAVRSSVAWHRRAEDVREASSGAGRWGLLLVAVIALLWSSTVVVDFQVVLTVLMTMGFGAAVVGLRYPWLGLLGAGILCTLNEMAAPLLLSGGLWRWNTVNYWLLLVTLLFLPSTLRLDQVQSRLLAAFIALLGLEILLSPDPWDGIQQVFGVVAAFGLLVYGRRAGRDPQTWHWLGVVSGVLAAGGSAAFLLHQGALPYVNPNVWSYLPLTALLVTCLAFVATEQRPHRRWVLVLLAVINAVWVFLSGSRGSLAIAALGVGFLFTVMKLHRMVLFAIAAALVSTVIVSQFTPLQDRALARLRLLVDANESLSVRTSGRADLALAGWYLFTDHPFGVGTGGFRTSRAELGAREGLAPVPLGERTAAHSGWVKVLVENGIPGILLLAAYVGSFAVSGWRAGGRSFVMLGLLVSAVLAVAWVATELQNKALWLLAAGATVLLARTPRGSVPA